MLQSPTVTSWLRVSPLEVLITRACEPSLHEPNYALHLEVAEYINNKKANTYGFPYALTRSLLNTSVYFVSHLF